MALLSLHQIPGFAVIKDFSLQAEKPAYSTHVQRIQSNAAFGMVRLEIFHAQYHNGDTVILPTSNVDGYQYSREELNYFWTVVTSADPLTGWVSGESGSSLYLVNWKVDQDTGLVTSEEYYRTSDTDLKSNGKTNDGTLRVFTIAQRQKTTLTIPVPPAYVAHNASEFYTDRPYNTSLIEDINHNSQFGTVSTEVFYMGEFINADQVPRPTSPIDGYHYSYSECKFVHCWRWSTKQSTFQLPDNFLLQLEALNCIVDGTGHVAISVWYKPSGDVVERTDHGRVAILAFCRRTMPSLTGTPVDFTEIDPQLFFPGQPLRANELSIINDNTKIACSSPEFFGPTRYTNGQNVPLPVSPIDGYHYSRDELWYLHDWGSTSLPNPPYDSDIRLLILQGFVNVTGGVQIVVWRLATGGIPVLTHDGQLDVLTVGVRNAQNPAFTAPDPVPPDNPAPPPPEVGGGGTGTDVYVDGVFVGTIADIITVDDPGAVTVDNTVSSQLFLVNGT